MGNIKHVLLLIISLYILHSFPYEIYITATHIIFLMCSNSINQVQRLVLMISETRTPPSVQNKKLRFNLESECGLLVPNFGLKLQNCFLLLRRKFSAFQTWPEVIDPPQSATLPVSSQAYESHTNVKKQKGILQQKHFLCMKIWIWSIWLAVAAVMLFYLLSSVA